MAAKLLIFALICASHVLGELEISFNNVDTEVDPEQKIAYWREDLGISLNHWHYHLVYPFDGPDVAVHKDRRGELFYYVHHQFMSRVNIERLCNDLDLVVPLSDFRQPLPEAYYPIMNKSNSDIAWVGRPANLILSDVNRQSFKITIANLELWKKNIKDAIKAKAARNSQGQTIPLDEKTGIEVLINMLQAVKSLSPDFDFYGNLHNDGHVAISLVHDPDNSKSQLPGVMMDSTVSMRDPLFYRWHGFIDNLIREFKDGLPPYSKDQLSFGGVIVMEAAVGSTSDLNILNTHWTTSDIVLSRGLDFNLTTGPIPARMTHLNHDAFSYTITANNTNNREVMGTVRIFIAPRLDKDKRPLNFNDQRFLMIEMDKFITTLQPGKNTITRQSTDSAITIPFDATFRDLNKNKPDDKDVVGYSKYAYCGCGWPQHMLVPKGTKEGYPMDMFVMISDYQQDKVNQGEPDKSECRTGTSFCGLKGLKYPDARAIGYPFDRKSDVSSMDQFRTPNMFVQPITVKFHDTFKS